MKPHNVFAELDKSLHDRKGFDCGEKDLNEFLKTQALKHMKAGISLTRVFRAKNKNATGKYDICSFYTVSASTIKKESLPENQSKKLPHYPVPVFIIGQLAVNATCQGQRLGMITLINAIKYLCNVNNTMPVYAITVDCLNEDVESFYLQYGFTRLCVENNRIKLYLPIKTAQALM